MRETLAARDMPRVTELMEKARGMYGGDPRWKSLEQEATKIIAYESALGHVEQQRNHGDLDKAEERLTSLIREGSPDDRASRLLQEVREQRFLEQLKEADCAVGRGDFDTGLMLIEALRTAAPPEWTVRLDAAYQQVEARREQELARERQAEIASASAGIRERLQRDEVPQAAAQLAGAKAKFPNESVWFVIQREIEARKSLIESLEGAEQERKRGDFDAADAFLAFLKTSDADAERVRVAREAIASERDAKQRAEALESCRRQQEEERETQRQIEQAENEGLALEVKRHEEEQRPHQRQEEERERQQPIEQERFDQAERERPALEAKRLEEERQQQEEEDLAKHRREREREQQREQSAPPAPATAKKTRWALPVALLGLLAAGAGGWLFWSHRDSSSTPVSRTPAANPPAPTPPAANRPGPTAPVPPPAQPPTSSPQAVQTPRPEAPSKRHAPPAAKSVTVPDGTQLRLTLAREVPADAPVGTPLAFVVAADLVVNGDVAIVKGAAAKGVIAEPGRKRRILSDLKAAYRLISVDAVDGKSLRVRAAPARSGDEGKRPMIGTAKGTQFSAYVDGDVTVTVRAP